MTDPIAILFVGLALEAAAVLLALFRKPFADSVIAWNKDFYGPGVVEKDKRYFEPSFVIRMALAVSTVFGLIGGLAIVRSFYLLLAA